MNSPLEVPVLIVGAGPAGLVAAAELARHGVEALVIERRPQPSDHPRATGVSLWTMELLRSWGLEQEVRSGEIDAELRGWVGETLATPEGREYTFGVPTRAQSAAVSPTSAAWVPQDHLEPVLRRHAERLGARVQAGTELVEIVSRGDGVEALVRRGDGRLEPIRARYVIAADGAHSTVRKALGIAMRGPGTVLEAVAALFHAPLWPVVGSRRYGIYAVTDPGAAGVVVAAGRGDRWVYGYTRQPGVLDGSLADAETMAGRIRVAAGVPDLAVRVDRVGTFAYTAQLADRFRDGDIFLVGGAAHRMTPRGATGMNTAVRDGYDLGWKLAWTLRGWADAGILASYDAERRPVAAHNVWRSADPNGSLREVTDELHVDLGGRIPHIWVGAGPDRRSTIDLLGPGLTRFTGPDGGHDDGAAAAAFPKAPVVERPLPALTARALGIGPRGALVVRPDGVPARVTAEVMRGAA